MLTAYFGKETLFKNVYVYSAYADDTTFSFKNVISIKHMVDTFFCIYPDESKYLKIYNEFLKEVQVAVCGMRSINLNNAMLKILSTHFSYNKKTERGKIN